MLLESTIAYIFGVNTNEITVGMCLKFIHMVFQRTGIGTMLSTEIVNEMRADVERIKNG